jgi:O-antigen/teichoic acid export membrane protein
MARARRTGASMIASLLLQARNLVISLVVFRLFADPATVWGTVNNVVAVVTLLLLPAKLGLEFTAVQLVSKYRDDAPAAAVEALRVATWLRVGLTLAFALPMLLAPGAVGALTGLGDVPDLVVIGGWLLLTTSLYEYATFVQSGLDDFTGMMMSRLLYTVANIAAIGWAAMAWTSDGAVPVLWAQVLGGAVATVWGTYGVWRAVGRLPAGGPLPDGVPRGPDMVRTVLAFSLPMTIIGAAGQLFSYVDRVILPVLSSREELGTYAVATSVVSAALFPTFAVRNVARTRLPGALRRDPAEARRVLLASYRATMGIAVLIAAGTVACADDLLRALFGAEARDAATMLQWLVPWTLLTAFSNLSATALVAADRPRTYAWLTGALSVLVLALNLALVPSLGGYGAIASSTLSLVPLTLLSWREVAHSYGGLWSWQTVRDSAPAALRLLGAGAVALGVGSALSAPGLLASAVAGVATVAVYGGILLALGELRAIREAL